MSRVSTRSGTCTDFIGKLIDSGANAGRRFSIKVVHPPRFSFARDPKRPVVMFAGGTGVAPFRGMLEARAGQTAPEATGYYTPRARLVTCTTRRTGKRFAEPASCACHAELFQREGARARFDGNALCFEAGPGAHRQKRCSSRTPQSSCGRWPRRELLLVPLRSVTGFARTVMRPCRPSSRAVTAPPSVASASTRLVRRRSLPSRDFHRLPGRAVRAAPLIYASEVVLHNSPESGYWMVINGRVYDVTDFARMHPRRAEDR